jgi:hypothetical protein
MADPQETFSDVQPIQQKAAPAADASAPQETFTDVTPIAVSKPPVAPKEKPAGDIEQITEPVTEAAKGLYHGVMGHEESPESKGETTTASPEAANLGFTPEHLGYKAGEMVHGIGKFAKEAATDVLGNTPIAIPNEPGVGVSDPKAHTLLAKYVTAPSQAERDASQNEMQKYFESQGPEAAGHAISSFLHGTLGEYVPLVGPLAMSLTDQAAKGDIGGALAQLASLYAFEKGTGAVKEGIKGRVQDAVNSIKSPEIKQAEANVKALEKDRATAQTAYDKALAEHNKHAASHAQGIQSPEKVVKELTKAQAALDEATAHHELAKEDLAAKTAAQPTIPQRVGTAVGKVAAKVLPTPVPAPEVPTEAIEAQPSPLKPLGTPEPARAVAPPINVKTPGQVQPETFPQEPTARPRTPLGRIELANEQGTVGKTPLLTEGTPEGPQLPPGGLPKINIPEAPKPVPAQPAVDEAALRALSAKEGKVVETPEKKIGRLLQEALKPAEKAKETPEEYKGEERREKARPATMTPTEIEEAMKNRKPVHTPFDVTEGAMDTIKRDKALPKSPAEEFAEKTALPKAENTGYEGKKEEIVPTGAEGRTPAKSAEEYHPAVEQKVSELSDENLKKLAKAHGLNPDEYDFKARDERRHRVERDQLAKDITAQMGEDEKINIGRAAENTEREPGFASRDTTAQSKAERAAKVFPRLRGPVDEFGNPKVSGGSEKLTPKGFLKEAENHPDLHFSSEYEGDLENDKGTTIRLKAVSNPDRVRISDLQSADKGKGGATDMLSTITKLADKHGISLELTASPYGDEATRLNHDQLKTFYERHGFIPEAGKDPALGYMIREPKTPEVKEAEKYANPEKGIPETSLAKGPEAEKLHAATVQADKLAKEWSEAAEGKPKAEKTVDVAKHASDYNKSESLPEIKPEKIEKSPRAKEIADAYTAMKHDPNDPEVKKSYAALIDDVKKQWDYATNKMGIKIEPTDKDPYGFSGEGKPAEQQLVDDVKNNKHLGVWRGGNPLPEDHPLAQIDPKTGENYNTMFRAVHDIFGHVAQGHDFSEPGEESAWNVHRQMMSPEAAPAMTTETRGQTSWFFNHGEKPGTFADQKAGILPDFANAPTPDAKAALDHIKSGKDFAVLTAENPNNERATPEENEKRNRALVEDLRKKGYEPVPVEGNTKDVEGQKEHSYFVPDITPKEAAELGRKHGQAAVLTTEGLHDLKTDIVNPSDNKNILTGEEARKQPYYSKVGDTDFSVPIDFDKAAEPGKAPLPTVSGGSGKLPTGDALIKKYGESSGDPKDLTFILKDGRGVKNTGNIHDEMLGGRATDKNPPRERFVAEGNIRVRPHQGTYGREVAFSIPESGVNEKQLEYIKKMSPQLRSGAVMIEVGKVGGAYKAIEYNKATPEELEKTIRSLGPVLNDKGSPIDENGNPTVSGGSGKSAGNISLSSLKNNKELIYKQDLSAKELNHNDASWFMTSDGGFIGSKDAPHHGEIAEIALGGLDPKDKGTGEDWHTLYKFMKSSNSIRILTGDEKSVNIDVNSVPTTSQMRKLAYLSKDKEVYWSIGGPRGANGSGSFSDFQRSLDKNIPKVSGGSPEAGAAKAKTGEPVEGLKEKLPELAQKHLTEEEKNSLTTTATGKPRTAGTTKFIENMEKIPSVQEYRDIALAGEGARKWYSRSTAAFDAMHKEAPDYFKEGDKDKFMGVLAGSSPQQSVANNLREALGFWKEWNDAGRPDFSIDKWKQFGEEADKAWKEDGSPRAKGLKTGASMHWDYAPTGDKWKAENLLLKNLTLPDTKVPNIIKAINGEDMWPDLQKNAAFKAPSFAKNLQGWLNHVTNDSWMGLFGGIDKSALSKPENYHPLSVATRAAAQELGWEPAEAQAAIWSFTQALTERGEEDPEIIRQYSEDFKDLLAKDEITRGLLEDLGVNLDQLDRKLEAIGEKPEISGRTTATTSRSIDKLKERIEDARGKGAIPPAKSAQGEFSFREPHPTRTGSDEEDTSFDPNKFRTQTSEPLTKLGEKKKKSPFGTIR